MDWFLKTKGVDVKNSFEKYLKTANDSQQICSNFYLWLMSLL